MAVSTKTRNTIIFVVFSLVSMFLLGKVLTELGL